MLRVDSASSVVGSIDQYVLLFPIKLLPTETQSAHFELSDFEAIKEFLDDSLPRLCANP